MNVIFSKLKKLKNMNLIFCVGKLKRQNLYKTIKYCISAKWRNICSSSIFVFHEVLTEIARFWWWSCLVIARAKLETLWPPVFPRNHLAPCGKTNWCLWTNARMRHLACIGKNFQISYENDRMLRDCKLKNYLVVPGNRGRIRVVNFGLSDRWRRKNPFQPDSV